MRQFCPEGVFLDVIGTKILRILFHAIQRHLRRLSLPPPPPPWFFGLELKVDGGLALFTLSLCLPIESSIVFYLITLYLYMNTPFPHRNNN